MDETHELKNAKQSDQPATLPISVIIAAKNEARNLPRCLQSLRGVSEVFVIDSQSTDATVEVARNYGAQLVQFYYHGGWPKRQWAIDTLPLTQDWILLIDADEALTPELGQEISRAIRNPGLDGYYLALQIFFLGRLLKHSGASFWKLALFRRGKGHYECRLADQSPSMADMEVHEHVVVEGHTAKLSSPLVPHNVESLSRYIQKHDEYSNWESKVWLQGDRNPAELPPSLFGTQAQRRRWLKSRFLGLPGSPLFLFLYRYGLRLGFLDGIPGLIYCAFQAIQLFHVKAKIYELKSAGKEASTRA